MRRFTSNGVALTSLIGLIIGTAVPAHASGILEASILDRGFLGDQAQSGFIGNYTEMYGSRPQGASPESIYPYFVARGRKDIMSGAYTFHGEGEASFNMAVPSTTSYYVDIPELYVERPINKEWTATFGRKKFEWSVLDDVWQQGLWQPLFRWNYFDPEPEGMTGFFADYHDDKVSAVLFASPVFIPEQDATYQIKNGAFTTNCPFFNDPLSTLSLFGQPTNIIYQLGTYNIAKIVGHPGAGGMLRVGAERGMWVKLSYAYQPLNQILIGYQGLLNLNTNNVNVTLNPLVYYHHLAALEAGWDWRPARVWASVTSDTPISQNTPTSWTTEQISQSLLAAAGIDGILWGEGPLAAHAVASYLYREGGVQSDQGPLAVANGSIFESRFTVQDAVTGTVEIPLTHSYKRRLTSRTHAIYDFSVLGALVSSELRYESSDRWVLTIGGDLVGAIRQQSPSEGGADLFYMYRNNNRLRGGITYVF